jgi:hypothetical protein
MAAVARWPATSPTPFCAKTPAAPGSPRRRRTPPDALTPPWPRSWPYIGRPSLPATANRPSTSERTTTPGASLSRGRSADRAGHAIQPGLRADGIPPKVLGGPHPNHRPTKERQRRCRRYGRATNTPAEGRNRPARPGWLRYGPAHPRAALERTLRGRQALQTPKPRFRLTGPGLRGRRMSRGRGRDRTGRRPTAPVPGPMTGPTVGRCARGGRGHRPTEPS